MTVPETVSDSREDRALSARTLSSRREQPGFDILCSVLITHPAATLPVTSEDGDTGGSLSPKGRARQNSTISVCGTVSLGRTRTPSQVYPLRVLQIRSRDRAEGLLWPSGVKGQVNQPPGAGGGGVCYRRYRTRGLGPLSITVMATLLLCPGDSRSRSRSDTYLPTCANKQGKDVSCSTVDGGRSLQPTERPW